MRRCEIEKAKLAVALGAVLALVGAAAAHTAGTEEEARQMAENWSEMFDLAVANSGVQAVQPPSEEDQWKIFRRDVEYCKDARWTQGFYSKEWAGSGILWTCEDEWAVELRADCWNGLARLEEDFQKDFVRVPYVNVSGAGNMAEKGIAAICYAVDMAAWFSRNGDSENAARAWKRADAVQSAMSSLGIPEYRVERF